MQAPYLDVHGEIDISMRYFFFDYKCMTHINWSIKAGPSTILTPRKVGRGTENVAKPWHSNARRPQIGKYY